MAYSTTRTTTGSRLCRSLAAYSRDSHDPSARTWSTGSVGAVLPVLARHNSSAPVAAAVRHSLAPTNNRSANSSTPAKPPCSTSPSSRPASVVSPVAYDPIAALIVAWVPHSTSPPARSWPGRTPPRCRRCRPRPAWPHPPPAAATADTTPPACPGSPAAEQPWQTAPAAAPDPAERAPAPAPTSPAASAAPQGRRGGARGGAAPPPAAAAPPGRRHQQTAPTPARNRPPC